jgi:biopolymer transport protein ExbB
MKVRRKCIAGSVLSALLISVAAPVSAQAPVAAPSAAPAAAPDPRSAAAPPASAQDAPAQPVPVQALSSPGQGQTAPAADDTARAVSSTGRLQRDLSPWSMFLTADVLVKAVMVSLAFASLATWTIFFAKTVQLSHTQRRLRAALGRIADARTLSEAQLALNGGDTALSALLRAALQEVRLSGDGSSDDGIKERAASRFSEIARAEARSMRQGMAILATIGATSPFVGLFGTVWGIMNSFIGISKAQTTNLAVVAPGIAEALLATAIGLVAAIPAVIIYNHFSRVTKGYLEFVGRGSGAVGRLLSRDLDRVRGRLATRAAE